MAGYGREALYLLNWTDCLWSDSLWLEAEEVLSSSSKFSRSEFCRVLLLLASDPEFIRDSESSRSDSEEEEGRPGWDSLGEGVSVSFAFPLAAFNLFEALKQDIKKLGRRFLKPSHESHLYERLYTIHALWRQSKSSSCRVRFQSFF